MSPLEYTALAVAALIFLIGLVSTLLPVIPGSLIVWLGVLVHKLWLGEASVSWKMVLLTGAITLVAQLLDVVMGVWGARRFGASWKGALGAFLGALIGLFLPPPLFWLIVGPIAGAILGELSAGRSWGEGGKAGLGTIIGGLLAFGMKLGLSFCVILLFFLSLP